MVNSDSLASKRTVLKAIQNLIYKPCKNVRLHDNEIQFNCHLKFSDYFCYLIWRIIVLLVLFVISVHESLVALINLSVTDEKPLNIQAFLYYLIDF